MRSTLAQVFLICAAALAAQPGSHAQTVIGTTMDANEMNRRLTQLAERPDARFWRVSYEALSAPERVFRSVWELEAEVNNGGFHQYFWNSSGSLAPHAPAALRAIGASTTAGIVESAIAAVGRDIPWSDERARQTRLDAIEPQRLERFDDAFYAYPDNLTMLLYRYASEHRGDLGLSPDF
jgi:hypothetical protein